MACLCVLAAVACDDNETPGRASGATIEATATATPVPTAHPAYVRTGWPEVDYVLGLVEARDAERLRAWFLERSIPCRDGPGGAPAPPRCDGHPEGTQLLAFPYSPCGEGTYATPAREAAILDAFFRGGPQPYAINLRMPDGDPAYSPRFSVFYVADETFHVLDLNERGRVVSVHHACHQQPFDQVLALHSKGAPQWILPPPGSSEPRVAAPTPTATPPVAPLPMHHPTTRTGNAGVDATLDAVFSNDPVQIASRIRFRGVACAVALQGIGAPPACPEGAEEGTPVEAVSGNSCEGYFITREGLSERPLTFDDYSDMGLCAVLQREEGFVVMFSVRFGASTPQGLAFSLDPDGRITHFDSGCGEPPGERYVAAGGTFLLPPA